MFQPDELRQINDLLSRKKFAFEVQFHPADHAPDGTFSAELQAIVKALKGSSSYAAASKKIDQHLPDRPALTLRTAGRGAINYLALPQGPEFSPFISLLTELCQTAPVPTKAQDPAPEGSLPAHLQVFVASSCPHCPNAVLEALRVALVDETVAVSIIDVQQYPDLAETLHVKSVPFSVLDGQLSWTGVKKTNEIRNTIARRNEASYPVAVFQSLIESGRLEQAAAELLRQEAIAPFLAAWEQSAISSRIGLLLVVEECLETDPRILDSAVTSLITLLGAEDAALRGDTADLLGRIGHEEAVPHLEKLLGDENPDVAEIAEEAIEEIYKNNVSANVRGEVSDSPGRPK